MKKLIALSVMTLTLLFATGCGTPVTDTTKTPEAATGSTISGFIGSCLVSFNNSCQDYENSKNYEAATLASECTSLGTAESWSTKPCSSEYVSGCKSQVTGLSGGTADVTIWYKANDTFLPNFKSGCTGKWIDR